MTKEHYIIWKQLGETPLEALGRLRTALSLDESIPMTYAGRLDPAAEGLLIVLAGEECKKKENYTSLPKTYLAEILIGVSTDSYDLLGIPTLGTTRPPLLGKGGENTNQRISFPACTQEGIEGWFLTELGSHSQKYPPYSSKTVDGVQLHEHARNGTDIALPEHIVSFDSFEDVILLEVESEDVLLRAGELIAGVTGDFRQAEIAQAWATLDLPEKLTLLSVELHVGSGFYVRQLAEDLGRALGTGACLYSLIRTRIGEYTQAGY